MHGGMKTLILDNYDSFTFNLFQYIAELGGNPIVKKNDEILLLEIDQLQPSHIVISPGPGTPVEKRYFGICGDVIKKYAGKIPILGVCLGHQGIAHVFGGRIVKAPMPMHGKTSTIKISNRQNIFRGMPERIKAMRYHSLIVERETLPLDFIITAETEEGRLVMAFQHKEFPLWGIQFHPESIETPLGKDLLKNFLMSL